jgi:threonine/homoserine/homoserine lactone efflux protein
LGELTDLLFRGLVIGLSIAAPVGPIGVLCIRRTLAEGAAAGFVSGLGAATADALYGCVAGFGLTFVSGLLVRQQVWFRLVGGLFLCYLGIKTLLSGPVPDPVEGQRGGLLRAYALTFFLTLTNPMTILAFAAIFAGLGLVGTGQTYLAAVVMVAGVFAGSALWWLTLSGGVSLFRKRFSLIALQWVNRISGLVITGFGLVSLFSVLPNT